VLQGERSRVRVPMGSLDFSSLPNPSSRTMVMGSTQPITEMNTRNPLGGKGRPARKADNFTDYLEKCGSLDLSQVYGPPQPVTGIDLPLPYSLLPKNFLFSTSFRPALGSTQPPIQWAGVGALFPLAVKRPWHETHHSQLVPRSRKCGSIHPLPRTPSWRSA
jgi:hypothetical protein